MTPTRYDSIGEAPYDGGHDFGRSVSPGSEKLGSVERDSRANSSQVIGY